MVKKKTCKFKIGDKVRVKGFKDVGIVKYIRYSQDFKGREIIKCRVLDNHGIYKYWNEHSLVKVKSK